MKKLSQWLLIAAVYIAAGIICSPVLCIFNEQPDSEPQRWGINLFGFAWLAMLIFVGKRIYRKG